jgi:hypothetical protein
VAVTDSFLRPDAPNLGANWTNTQNGMKIVSDSARVVTDVVYNFARYTGVSWNATHTSQAEGSVSGDMEITVRHQASGDLYMAMINVFSGVTRLYKYISSSFTQIVDFGVTPSGSSTYRIEVSGSTLKLFKDGVQVGTDQSDSDLSGGGPGIGGATAVDNWDIWVGTGEVAATGKTFVLTRL